MYDACYELVSIARQLQAAMNVRVDLPTYNFVPAMADPAPGTKDLGFSTDDNVMPAVGIIVYVNGEEKGLWSIQEFRDRCKSLQEIIDSGIAVTSKEYDPFVIT